MKLHDILTEAWNKDQIEQWLKKMKVENYTVNDNLTVDVDGDVTIFNKGIDNWPFQWGRIKGNFFARHNRFKDLARFPKVIDGDLSVAHNPNIDLFKVKGGIKLKGKLLLGNDFNLKSLVGVAEAFSQLGDDRSTEQSGLVLSNAHRDLEAGGIGLLAIPHSKFVFREDYNTPAIKALTIIAKYKDRREDIFECHEELEEAGLSEFAVA